MNKFFISILVVFIALQSKAQMGGETTYDFLNLSSSARINSIGGNNVSLNDSLELSMSYYNPATLAPGMDKSLNFNFISYVAQIKQGYAAYAFNKENIGTFAVGMHYVNYGEFIAADEDGVITGDFSAGDYFLNLIYSRELNENIRIGANLKPIYSAYEDYSSLGISSDFGITYTDSTGLFSAGLVLKNLGRQITTYQILTDGVPEPLPIDLQLGFTQKFAHAPFRLHFTFQNLLNWQLTDFSTWESDNAEQEEYTIGDSDTAIRQFMRHLVFGAEFLPSENVVLSFGYNYQRRRELGLYGNPGGSGLSAGFTIKINRFRLSYALGGYHLSGATNSFSMSTNLNQFIN